MKSQIQSGQILFKAENFKTCNSKDINALKSFNIEEKIIMVALGLMTFFVRSIITLDNFTELYESPNNYPQWNTKQLQLSLFN